MFGNIAVKLVMHFLRKTDLSVENRSVLTTCLLDKLAALPLSDMIKTDGQNLIVNGRIMNAETVRRLRESARAAQANIALRFVHEQVLYAAVVHGVHKLEKTEQSFFSRAAIWWGQQEKQNLAVLAGVEESELDA